MGKQRITDRLCTVSLSLPWLWGVHFLFSLTSTDIFGAFLTQISAYGFDHTSKFDQQWRECVRTTLLFLGRLNSVSIDVVSRRKISFVIHSSTESFMYNLTSNLIFKA